MKHERHTLASFDNPALIAAKPLQTRDEKAALCTLTMGRFAKRLNSFFAIKTAATAFLFTLASCASLVAGFHFIMGLWFFFALALSAAGAFSYGIRMMWRRS